MCDMQAPGYGCRKESAILVNMAVILPIFFIIGSVGRFSLFFYGIMKVFPFTF
jgi:hypothetical protein